MKCPSCPDTTLVMTDRQGVEIDYCPQCRGVWLDRGELDKILAKERSATAQDPEQDFFNEVEGRRSHDRPTSESGDYDSGKQKKNRKRSLLEDLLDFG